MLLKDEGLDNIGFVVDSVREKFQELVTKHATPNEIIPSRTGGWLAYLKDRNGDWNEIFQRNPPAELNALKGLV